MDTPVLTEIIQKINRLPDHLQRQVLVFVDALETSSSDGVPGKVLLDFAGTIPHDELKIMGDVIELGCEQVEGNEL